MMDSGCFSSCWKHLCLIYIHIHLSGQMKMFIFFNPNHLLWVKDLTSVLVSVFSIMQISVHITNTGDAIMSKTFTSPSKQKYSCKFQRVRRLESSCYRWNRLQTSTGYVSPPAYLKGCCVALWYFLCPYFQDALSSEKPLQSWPQQLIQKKAFSWGLLMVLAI